MIVQASPSASPPSADDDRWQAIVRRDPKADGGFVYGVKSTGVFCRPVCRSRRPLRKNIEFFDAPADAVRAGFRPCRRCRPDDSGPSPRVSAMRQACRQIESAQREPTLSQLARVAGLSPTHFLRAFRAVVGVTPKQYAKAHRVKRLRDNLPSASSVSSAIAIAGFNSAAGAYAAASQRLGMTPTAAKKGGAGLTLRCAIVKTSLDWMLVAATDRGVCLIAFADDKAELMQELRRRFPHAALREPDAEFEKWVMAAVQCVEEPASAVALPLDIRGTAFQERVWQELTKIPLGQTRTYAEVARMIDCPKAVRAVASACGENPAAIVVPCHRVIGSDKKLHGYRWGIERKKTLLAREQR